MEGRGFGYDPYVFAEGGLIRSLWVTIGRFRSPYDADPIKSTHISTKKERFFTFVQNDTQKRP